MYMKPNINFTSEIWKEGEAFVAWSPELDVSSMGGSIEEARKNLQEAARLFVEEAEKLGTLKEILLEEAGYQADNEGWRGPELLVIEKMSLALP